MWSPTWSFDEKPFCRSAASFDNPDFGDVFIHSYRHRFASMRGDSAVAGIEARLALLPTITAPEVAVDDRDGAANFGTHRHRRRFTGGVKYQALGRADHDLPQERPED